MKTMFQKGLCFLLIIAMGVALVTFSGCDTPNNPDNPTENGPVYDDLTGTGAFADAPIEGQLRIYGGATGFYTDTTYLTAEERTAVSKFKTTRSMRSIRGAGFVEYTIPVADLKSTPNYLAWESQGELKVSVNGATVYDGKSTHDELTDVYSVPGEVVLNATEITAKETMVIRFENISATDSSGQITNNGLLWFEIGATSPWTTRVEHILWDTQEVVWSMGYYDGTANEFCGDTREVQIGTTDERDMKKNGTMIMQWEDTEQVEGAQYWLLVGIIGNAITRVDFGCDGENEFVGSESFYECVYDIPIEKYDFRQLQLKIGSSAKLDFVALVRVVPGTTKDGDLKMVFKGGDSATDWTRLVNNSMYWTNDFIVDEGSGFVDASLMNGMYVNWYAVSDVGPAAVELLKWGYVDAAKQITTYYQTGAEFTTWDNGGAGLVFTVMAKLMQMENYKGEYTDKMYASLQSGMEYYCNRISNNQYHLILGTNVESTSGGYGIYNNSIAYFSMLCGIEAAQKTGHTEDVKKWTNHANLLKEGITQNLLLKNDLAGYGGAGLPAGVFRYSLTTTGTDVEVPAAGWFAIGNMEELYYGLEGNAVSEWRTAVNKMLDYFPKTFWEDWTLYGHNRGFGTSYGVLTERGGWPLSAMFMSDEMGMALKNLEHIIYNSVDYNFENDNIGVQETSPYLIVREVSAHDTGITGADVGNGGGVEDLNLVEYIVTMKNARIMAGVDDSLGNGDQLKIIPRIFEDWEGVQVNNMAVTYLKEGQYCRGNLSYDYTLNAEGAEILVQADCDIKGVTVRFGPFATDAVIEGADSTEISGDSQWAYKTIDISTKTKKYAVTATLPGKVTANGQGVYNLIADGELYCNTSVTFTKEAEEAGIYLAGYECKLTSSKGKNYGSLALLDGATGNVLQEVEINLNSNRTYFVKAVQNGGKLEIILNGVTAFTVDNVSLKDTQVYAKTPENCAIKLVCSI